MREHDALAPEGPAALALMPAAGTQWSCRGLELRDEETLRATFERGGSPDRIVVTVCRGAAEGERVFRRLRHVTVRYEGHLEAPSRERRDEVLALVDGLGHALDAALDAQPDRTLAAVLGRPETRAERVVFGRDSLQALLAPQILKGVPFSSGWVLHDVYPSSSTPRDARRMELVLELRHEVSGARTVVLVAARDDARPAFARTEHLSLVHHTAGAVAGAQARAACAYVGLVLQIRDHAGLEIVFPAVERELALALPAGAEPAAGSGKRRALNLAIDAECGQSCSFCSIKELRPAEDGGEALLERIRAELRTFRERGVEVLRVNGYDPLSYSRILEVLEHATRLGFARVELFSPCTRLADRAFCEQVVRAAPDDLAIDVPLYGAHAAVHDAVVARPGAFAQVLAALDHLAQLTDIDRHRITSVVTRENLGELGPMARLAAERGLGFRPHLPFASSESGSDRFFRVAARMDEIARAAQEARAVAPHLFVQGLPTCVMFDAIEADGGDPRPWVATLPATPALPGTEYRSDLYAHRTDFGNDGTFVTAAVPCPHGDACALSTVCPRDVHRAYVERHGLEELRAVTLHELLRGPPLDPER